MLFLFLFLKKIPFLLLSSFLSSQQRHHKPSFTFEPTYLVATDISTDLCPCVGNKKVIDWLSIATNSRGDPEEEPEDLSPHSEPKPNTSLTLQPNNPLGAERSSASLPAPHNDNNTGRVHFSDSYTM